MPQNHQIVIGKGDLFPHDSDVDGNVVDGYLPGGDDGTW